MFAFLQRRRDKEEGFTLIELMVVVLIIAILIAIAIPTFLGARTRAQDRAAQSSARNALTNAKTVFTDANAYGAGTTSAAATTALIGDSNSGLIAAEPSLTFQTTASSGPNVVSVQSTVVSPATSAAVVSMAVLSKSGTCYGVTDNSGTAVTGHPSGTTYGTISTCTGAAAEAANFNASSW